VCPEQLKPQELWRTLQAEDKPAAAAHQLDACILCAACNTVCPSQIPLMQTFALGQQQWHTHQAQQQRAALAQQRFEQRQQRLATATAEQQSRRARRAALAAQRRELPTHTTPDSTEPPQSPAFQALADRLAQAEQKLAEATPGERKAMQMTVRKLKQQLARQQNEAGSDA
jgi:electron transport complex protein RnfC